MAKKESNNKWGWIIAILIFLFFVAYVFSGLISLFISAEDIQAGNVAIIPIRGMILTESSTGLFAAGTAVSGRIVQDIEKADSNPGVKAIILEINSPGGAPVATDEIASAVQKTNKTTVAWIRETGASGAYWIASATDYVIANKLSIVGSIGVIGSYLEFSGFMDDWNVSYEKLTGGKYKDAGTPYRKLTDEERFMLQQKIDLMHQIFKDEVQKNRGLSNAQIESVSNGEFYIGSEAINLGLIDALGGKSEAIAYIEDKLQIKAQTAVYERKPTFLDLLAGMKSTGGLDILKEEHQVMLK